MKIEKNISATLKKEMERRGRTLMEFSSELGIPRSTLQGYLKGTSHPRVDSLEELAKKLGISPAKLVSGEECTGGAGISCLEPILLEFPVLHPRIMPIVKNTIALLRSVLQISDELYDLEEAELARESPDMVYRYFLHELRNPFRRSSSYGILGKERFEEGWTTVALVAAFSHDKAAVAKLVRRCTELQIAPEHLLDVVHDFIVKKAEKM